MFWERPFTSTEQAHEHPHPSHSLWGDESGEVEEVDLFGEAWQAEKERVIELWKILVGEKVFAPHNGVNSAEKP